MMVAAVKICAFTFLLLGHLNWAAGSFPSDAIIIQIQQSGVVGGSNVAVQVLLNGLPLRSPSQEISGIIHKMSASGLLPSKIHHNKISGLKDRIILRSRECVMERHQLLWADLVSYDGKNYLALQHNGTWTALVPEARVLKVLLDREEKITMSDKILLQEGCEQLMKELHLSDNAPEANLIPILVPVLGLGAFVGLVFISIYISKSHGWKLPGGVIGSIVHYPKGMKNTPLATVDRGYQTMV